MRIGGRTHALTRPKKSELELGWAYSLLYIYGPRGHLRIQCIKVSCKICPPCPFSFCPSLSIRTVGIRGQWGHPFPILYKLVKPPPISGWAYHAHHITSCPPPLGFLDFPTALLCYLGHYCANTVGLSYSNSFASHYKALETSLVCIALTQNVIFINHLARTANLLP